MSKAEEGVVRTIADRFNHGATLIAGCVYSVSWSYAEFARFLGNEVYQFDNLEIAWVTDPLRLREPGHTHTVVVGPTGYTVQANGKRHPDSRLKINDAHVRWKGARGTPDWSLPKVEPTSGWNLLCGKELEHVDLMVGWTSKDRESVPAGFTVSSTPRKTFYGRRLARVHAGSWSRIDLSDAALTTVKSELKGIAGAPKRALRLELVVDADTRAI